MAVTPNTILYLLKSPLELDNKNQLTFASETAQHEYFLSLPKIEVDRISYQRKDSTIRFPAHIDSLIGYNYVMYQNENYTNKWFYAYITNMRYENDGMTTITIETDCYQTWMFDIDIKKSFVVREHVNNDTVGLHTVPEGLETGDYIQNGNMIPFTYLRSTDWTHGYVPSDFYVCVACTRDLTDYTFPKRYGANNVVLFSGADYFIFKDEGDVTKCFGYLNQANTQYMDDVVSVFVVPKAFDYNAPEEQWLYPFGTGAGGYAVSKCDGDHVINLQDKSQNIVMKTTIDGYTPVNKKLLTSDYNYLYCTNYTGSDTTYKYEFFKGTTSGNKSCNFKLRGALAPGCSIELNPTEYQESNNFYQSGAYSLPAPKLPVCNWNNDQYTNWLAQTGTNRALTITGSIASIGAGAAMVASGGGALVGGGLIASGIGSIINQVAQLKDHSYAPNANCGSLNSSDVNFNNSRCFGFYPMSIRAEYARKIDGIFSTIGYKVNEMKIPNVTGRLNWNYVQTMEVAIQGTIPQEDLQTIKDMFNSGVTFWHNPSTFLDYSQNNGII